MRRSRGAIGVALLAIGLAAALLLPGTPATARVVPAPEPSPPDAAVRGGVRLPAAAPAVTAPAAPTAAASGAPVATVLGLPTVQLAWLLLAQMELVARQDAAVRVALAADRATWQAPRLIHGPLPARRLLLNRRYHKPRLPP